VIALCVAFLERLTSSRLRVAEICNEVCTARFRGNTGTTDQLNDAISAQLSGSIWARLDSNQGPTDYESAALTS
jgi:hypothetical protein